MQNRPTVRSADRESLHDRGPAPARLALVIVASPVARAVGRVVPLGAEPVVLGRVAAGDAEDDWMSREHATVQLERGVVRVRDGAALAGGWKPSANGTLAADLGADADPPAELAVPSDPAGAAVAPGHVIRTGRTLWLVVANPAAASDDSLLAGLSEAMGHVRDELALVVAEVALRFERQRRVTQALLVTGPRGTGKQVVAREAHRLLVQRRGDAALPFVDVAAPALAEGTSAADIFGVVDKYATDVKGRPGWFERAHGGVLLIDEIADLPLGEQAKLLGVLEERQVTRLGARAPLPFDCLVVAATNRDLDALVAAGAFRADLLDRLGRFRVRLPALAERVEDVLPVAAALLRRHGHAGPLPWDVALRLLARPWDGNVRELDAFVERLVAHARPHGVIDQAVFERAARGLDGPRRAAVPRVSQAPGDGSATDASTARGQAPPRDELLRVLEAHAWNKSEVGRHYGKHPRQITRWMEYLAIVRPS